MYYIYRLKTTSSNTLTHTASSTIPLSFIMVIMIKELRQTGGWLWRGVLLHKQNVSGLVLSLSKVFHTALEREREREREVISELRILEAVCASISPVFFGWGRMISKNGATRFSLKA
jgi:hypothetical protein